MSEPNSVDSATREAAIRQIIKNWRWEGLVGPHHTIPYEKGMFVLTGPSFSNEVMNRVGYLIQVRNKCGQFGSDRVFLRLADGTIADWQNQGFFKLLPEDEALARSVFESHPDDEDDSIGYWDCDQVHEIGFIIEKSASKPMQVSNDVSITITDTTGNTQIVSFI